MVADAGHSFVRRTTASLFTPGATRYRRSLYPSDIVDEADAVELARLHNLTDRVSRMYTFGLIDGRHVVTVQDLKAIAGRIRSVNPDFVLAHIASNEIANMSGDLSTSQWKSQIHDLIKECQDFADEFPADITVCFMDVVPRIKTRGINLSPERFNEYAKFYNYHMTRLHRRSVSGDDKVHPGLRFSKARGWRYADVPGQGNAVERPLDYMVGRDDIHPSLSTLRTAYSRCMQRAITEYQNIPARLRRC